MRDLPSIKFRRLLDAVHLMNLTSDHADFVSSVIGGLSRLINADYMSLHVLNPASGRLIHTYAPENPYTASEVAYYQAHSEENPLVAYYQKTQDNQARRMTDVVTQAEYLASGVYRHCNARMGFLYILALPLRVDKDTVAGLSFQRRRRNFSTQDCAVLDAFAPHFRLAWERHPDPWKVADSDAVSSRQQFRDSLGLTSREADVLYWISEGKQNAEIAQILDISFYTVQKHVANILKKTQTENRYALTVESLKHRRG